MQSNIINPSELDTFFSYPMYEEIVSNDSETLIDVLCYKQNEDVEKLLMEYMKIRESTFGMEHLDDCEDDNTELYRNVKKYNSEALSMVKDEIDSFNDKKELVAGKLNIKEYIILSQRELLSRLEIIKDSKYIDSKDEYRDMNDEIYVKTKLYFDEIIQCLQKDIETLNSNICSCKQKIKKLFSALSIPKALSTYTFNCPICMAERVQLFCDPCGHTYCNKCLKSTNCYICRMKIKKTNPIFFT